MGDKRKMKLSGELDYRIRYDVEHDLFHAQNVFSDEYIKPTFIEYVQKLEKENAELKSRGCWKSCEYANPKSELIAQHIKEVQQLTNAKEIIKKFSEFANLEVEYDPEHPQEHTDLWNELCKEAEQFLK